MVCFLDQATNLFNNPLNKPIACTYSMKLICSLKLFHPIVGFLSLTVSTYWQPLGEMGETPAAREGNLQRILYV
jgi:hypothetical protein